jgi:uncharacterized LabA/DUF88 family protein
MSNPYRINIYVDNQNVKVTLELANLLLVSAKMQGRVVQAKVYDFWPDTTPKSAHKNLENLGFQCLGVSSGIKDCADYQLVFDCISDLDDRWPDSIILVSGDGDFLSLVNHLKKIGIKAIVFARRGNVKKSLMESADEFHFIDELPELVDIENESERSETQTILAGSQAVFPSETPPDTSVHYITYDEAVQSLIEAIHTALSEGRATRFTYIDTLMRHNPNFPTYQGVASIQKPDGSQFAKFGEFIQAAIADGKVRLKENKKIQEVTLVGKTSAETTDAASQSKKQKKSAKGVTYDEAIHCLIEAIQTISPEGKCADLSCLDRVMRSSQRFPYYKGVSSIQKHKGKKFPKLSKFLEAAAKDKRVQLKKHNKKIKEVILIGKKG